MKIDPLTEKQNRLYATLEECRSLLVAFSGGVDSTLLLAAAKAVLGDRVTAVTAASALQPQWERDAAVALAEKLGAHHLIYESKEMENPAFLSNPTDRCYICKKSLFNDLVALAAERGLERVAHGANADDLTDYRPGWRAAVELDIMAPLVTAGFTKADVRGLSKRMGLSNWNKPAMACLASRIPYGTPIDTETLQKIEQAENWLREAGFRQYRVRCHGEVARIEVSPEDFSKLFEQGMREAVTAEYRRIGFRYVSLDLQGYCQGSLNRDV